MDLDWEDEEDPTRRFDINSRKVFMAPPDEIWFDHEFSVKDRCRFFDTAHGSTLECAAALDVLVARHKFSAADVRPDKARLQHIVRMLMGLIKRNSDRNYDGQTTPD